jgi:predicted anti-sigma-YlaC factor YlaD
MSMLFSCASNTGRPALCIALALVFTQGCALKTMALKTVANTLSESGDTFASDDDPELVRDAVPFALKTYESLLASLPRHRGLLLATCSGFTQYSYAFVQADAEAIEAEDFERSLELRERSLRLYLRGRDYCLRGLEEVKRGLGAQLATDPAAALQPMKREHVPLLYWTAASWGAAVSLALDRPAIAGGLRQVRALASRALALDEGYLRGAIHELMVTLESVPEAMGGSVARARRHFDRAVALQEGKSAGPYVTLATAVALPAQGRAEFVRLLESALAVDPDADKSRRLATLIAQRRARFLMSRVEELFPGSEVPQP